MKKRLTAGALSLKAASDLSHYNGIEVAEAQMHDVGINVFKSAHDHLEKFDEEMYCVVMVRASDPLIHGLVRQKFYSYPYLPSPRPEQAVWLYYKASDQVRFLWSLPPAKVMAAISEAGFVATKWKRTKGWCDAFFAGQFWEHIREQHGIDLLSEHEYLKAHRAELIEASGNQRPAPVAEPFDFSKIQVKQIVDTKTARLD